MEGLLIGLDFDGTCAKHRFPEIGEEIPNCIATLKRLQAAGAKIILNTMRSDENALGKAGLSEAVAWLRERGIELYGVNENPTQKEWTHSPKVYAHIYIDDAALGTPLVYEQGERPYVDWFAVEKLLFSKEHQQETIHK